MSAKSISVVALGEPIAVDLVSDEVDLRTVASASLKVQRTDRTTAEWACTLGTATETRLRIEHVVQPGDLTRPGTYSLYARLVLSGGSVRESDVMLLPVRGEFERS